jgi:predicted nucleotidyltransferase
MSNIKSLYKSKHIKNIEPWIVENIQYETIMGSQAYGVSSDNSDLDLYSFTVPPRGIVFPHTQGFISGFGKQPPNFKVYQQHHIETDGVSHDINVYNIVSYFQLLMDNNPNLIDSLFTRTQSVTHSTKIGNMVKDQRRIFLHKGAWHRFKGYAYAQMKKLRSKHVEPESKRFESIMKYGYDVKHAYHVVRLLNEVEQILMYGDIDLMQNNDQLKDVRNGEWSLEFLEQYFETKEVALEKCYHQSELQKYPDETRIKQLLLDCLEEFYGQVSEEEVRLVSEHERAIEEIKQIMRKL